MCATLDAAPSPAPAPAAPTPAVASQQPTPKVRHVFRGTAHGKNDSDPELGHHKTLLTVGSCVPERGRSRASSHRSTSFSSPPPKCASCRETTTAAKQLEFTAVSSTGSLTMVQVQSIAASLDAIAWETWESRSCTSLRVSGAQGSLGSDNAVAINAWVHVPLVSLRIAGTLHAAVIIASCSWTLRRQYRVPQHAAIERTAPLLLRRPQTTALFCG